jgi:hypothetical protein
VCGEPGEVVEQHEESLAHLVDLGEEAKVPA